MTEQSTTPTVVILSKSDDNCLVAVSSVRALDPTCPVIVIDDGLHPMSYRTLDVLKVRRIVPVPRWIAVIDGSWQRQARKVQFVFALNANIGLRAAFDAGAEFAVLMNDDCELQTPAGFTTLASIAASDPSLGLLSPAIDPAVIPQQQAGNCPIGESLIRVSQLMFPCMLVPRSTFDLIGPLDERFVGYGFDDNDYCARVLAAGLDLAVEHSVVVSHCGKSEYRSRPGWEALMSQNAERFYRKQRGMVR